MSNFLDDLPAVRLGKGKAPKSPLPKAPKKPKRVPKTAKAPGGRKPVPRLPPKSKTRYVPKREYEPPAPPPPRPKRPPRRGGRRSHASPVPQFFIPPLDEIQVAAAINEAHAKTHIPGAARQPAPIPAGALVTPRLRAHEFRAGQLPRSRREVDLYFPHATKYQKDRYWNSVRLQMGKAGFSGTQLRQALIDPKFTKVERAGLLGFGPYQLHHPDFGNAIGKMLRDIVAIPGGIYMAGKAVATDWARGDINLTETRKLASEIAKTSWYQLQHPGDDPFATALLITAIFNAGAGFVAKGAGALSIAGEAGTIAGLRSLAKPLGVPVREFRVGGFVQRGRYSRARSWQYIQRAHDWALHKLASEERRGIAPVGQARARGRLEKLAGKAARYQRLIEEDLARAPAEHLSRIRLSTPKQIALRMAGEGWNPEEGIRFHEDRIKELQAQEHTLKNILEMRRHRGRIALIKLAARFVEATPNGPELIDNKLAQVYDDVVALTKGREDFLEKIDMLSSNARKARIYAPSRVIAGGARFMTAQDAARIARETARDIRRSRKRFDFLTARSGQLARYHGGITQEPPEFNIMDAAMHPRQAGRGRYIFYSEGPPTQRMRTLRVTDQRHHFGTGSRGGNRHTIRYTIRKPLILTGTNALERLYKAAGVESLMREGIPGRTEAVRQRYVLRRVAEWARNHDYDAIVSPGGPVLGESARAVGEGGPEVLLLHPERARVWTPEEARQSYARFQTRQDAVSAELGELSKTIPQLERRFAHHERIRQEGGRLVGGEHLAVRGPGGRTEEFNVTDLEGTDVATVERLGVDVNQMMQEAYQSGAGTAQLYHELEEMSAAIDDVENVTTWHEEKRYAEELVNQGTISTMPHEFLGEPPDVHGLYVLGADGKPLAVGSYEILRPGTPEYTQVNSTLNPNGAYYGLNAGSRGSTGAGLAMMVQMARRAVEDGMGLYWGALPGAVDFYNKIMPESVIARRTAEGQLSRGNFEISAEEAQQFLDFVDRTPRGKIRIPYAPKGRLSRARISIGRSGVFSIFPKKPGTLTNKFTAGLLMRAASREAVTKLVANDYIEAMNYRHLLTQIERYRPAFHSARQPGDIYVRLVPRFPADIRRIIDQADEGVDLSKQDVELLGRSWEKFKEENFPKNPTEEDLLSGNVMYVNKRILGDLDAPPDVRYTSGALGQVVRIWDTLNSAAKLMIIYSKVGYIPPNLLGNIFLNMVQQGFLAIPNLYHSFTLYKTLEKASIREIDAGMGRGIARGLFDDETRNPIEALGSKTADILSTPTDLYTRRASFLYEARRAGFGLKRSGAHGTIEQLLNDERFAAEKVEVFARARRAAIEYEDMSHWEKVLARRILFIYPWLRGSTVYTLRMPLEHPIQSALYYQLGEQGVKQEQKDFPLGLPSYMKGIFRVGGSDKFPLVIDPRSAAIFQTPAEIAQAASAMFGIGNFGGQLPAQFLAPPLQAAIGWGYQINPQTREKLPPGTGFGDFLWQTFGRTTPIPALVTSLTEKPSAKAITQRTPGQALAHYFGGPTPYTISAEAAHKRYIKDVTEGAPAGVRTRIRSQEQQRQMELEARRLGLIGPKSHLPKKIRLAYKAQQERDAAIAKVTKHGDADYQFKAYEATINYLVSKGVGTQANANEVIRDAKDMTPEQIAKLRKDINKKFFSMEIVTAARHTIHQRQALSRVRTVLMNLVKHGIGTRANVNEVMAELKDASITDLDDYRSSMLKKFRKELAAK